MGPFSSLGRIVVAVQGPKAKVGARPAADKQQVAVSVGWLLGTSDAWVH